ncbi:hypothetical protein CANARDRAFT_27394 [[Candida] arabinofermentans NRRL YB-2248]|uniref:Uncharacterized protein n=1 Tax=[Candida] arabinofermentans NRRL YB-2248 TaxID=983967 RepID=A0A1E4T2Z8_9ASCO|nr:hypothetical protein CANARDRAFT_27394 [[Candida] arabinofermentans NRRL YB-2248]
MPDLQRTSTEEVPTSTHQGQIFLKDLPLIVRLIDKYNNPKTETKSLQYHHQQFNILVLKHNWIDNFTELQQSQLSESLDETFFAVQNTLWHLYNRESQSLLKLISLRTNYITKLVEKFPLLVEAQFADQLLNKLISWYIPYLNSLTEAYTYRSFINYNWLFKQLSQLLSTILPYWLTFIKVFYKLEELIDDDIHLTLAAQNLYNGAKRTELPPKMKASILIHFDRLKVLILSDESTIANVKISPIFTSSVYDYSRLGRSLHLITTRSLLIKSQITSDFHEYIYHIYRMNPIVEKTSQVAKFNGLAKYNDTDWVRIALTDLYILLTSNDEKNRFMREPLRLDHIDRTKKVDQNSLQLTLVNGTVIKLQFESAESLASFRDQLKLNLNIINMTLKFITADRLLDFNTTFGFQLNSLPSVRTTSDNTFSIDGTSINLKRYFPLDISPETSDLISKQIPITAYKLRTDDPEDYDIMLVYDRLILFLTYSNGVILNQQLGYREQLIIPLFPIKRVNFSNNLLTLIGDQFIESWLVPENRFDYCKLRFSFNEKDLKRVRIRSFEIPSLISNAKKMFFNPQVTTLSINFCKVEYFSVELQTFMKYKAAHGIPLEYAGDLRRQELMFQLYHRTLIFYINLLRLKNWYLIKLCDYDIIYLDEINRLIESMNLLINFYSNFITLLTKYYKTNVIMDDGILMLELEMLLEFSNKVFNKTCKQLTELIYVYKVSGFTELSKAEMNDWVQYKWAVKNKEFTKIFGLYCTSAYSLVMNLNRENKPVISLLKKSQDYCEKLTNAVKDVKDIVI